MIKFDTINTQCYNIIGDYMEKKFIKMNNNVTQLSLGNLIKIIKKNSTNKHLASQAEIFCIIFDIDETKNKRFG